MQALKPAPLGKVPVPNVPAESEGNSLDCQDQILSARYQSCPQVDLQETSVAQQSSSSSSSSSRVSLQAAPMFEVGALKAATRVSYCRIIALHLATFDCVTMCGSTKYHRSIIKLFQLNDALPCRMVVQMRLCSSCDRASFNWK